MFTSVQPEGVAYYKFSEWDDIPGFVHAFTSRLTDSLVSDAGHEPEVAGEKQRLLEVLGIERKKVRLVRQIHSAQVVTDPPPGIRCPGDGLLLSRPGIFGVIRTADCAPVLVVSRAVRATLLLHAGWRGTRDHIVYQGIRRFLQATGIGPEEVSVGIGPSIRACCYEVGQEVKQQFRESGYPVDQVFNGRLLNLVAAIRDELGRLGVSEILDCELCTACNSSHFYSYRKLKDQGRMWALAGFRSDPHA